jgi:hypothetical protein
MTFILLENTCLSRHCFPIRPGKLWAIIDHFVGPCLATNSMMRSSSTFVHAPFTKSGFKTFCHRWRHCTSVLSVKNSAIFFQFFPFSNCTALRSTSSSSGVQPPFDDLRVGPPVRLHCRNTNSGQLFCCMLMSVKRSMVSRVH